MPTSPRPVGYLRRPRYRCLRNGACARESTLPSATVTVPVTLAAVTVPPGVIDAENVLLIEKPVLLAVSWVAPRILLSASKAR